MSSLPLFDRLPPSPLCSPEDAIQQMEQKVNLLVEESAIASAEGNYQLVTNNSPLHRVV